MGINTSAGDTGKTTCQMLNLSTYKNIVNLGLEEAWDFVGNPNDDSANDDIWGISGIYNNGCPFLLWQGYEVSID